MECGGVCDRHNKGSCKYDVFVNDMRLLSTIRPFVTNNATFLH